MKPQLRLSHWILSALEIKQSLAQSSPTVTLSTTKPSNSITPTLTFPSAHPSTSQSASPTEEDRYTVGTTLVEFVGRSGKLRFCKLDDGSTTCNGRSIQLKMDRLHEVDSTGTVTKNKVSSFASQDYTWSRPEEIDIVSDGTSVRGTKVSFTAELRVGSNAPSAPRANFFMETVTYHANGTAQNGNQTVLVPRGALKFTMGVENWPFLDAGNFLQFGIDVRVSRRDGTDLGLESATEASINQQQVQFNLGDGLMIGVPKTAVLDGAQRDIEAVLDVGANRQSIDWTFPSFQTSLFYDPVVGAEEASSPSSEPSFQPSSFPSEAPSSEPSSEPSFQPSPPSSESPSSQPSSNPSETASGRPSGFSSSQPSSVPPESISSEPSNESSLQPSLSESPSGEPSARPSNKRSLKPSSTPSRQPSLQPSSQPSSLPSLLPSLHPSAEGSSIPSKSPSLQPKLSPKPSSSSSHQLSTQPSSPPFSHPSLQPSVKPSPVSSVSSSSVLSSSIPSAHPSTSQSASPTEEDRYTVGTTLVEFVGRSGQLRFCKLDDGATTCNGRSIQLKMDRLHEVDSTGGVTKNKVSSFASQDYTWSRPEEIDIVSDGTSVRGTKVSFSAELRVGSNAPSAPRANFFMETVTYHANGTAQNGNQTVLVPRGALKFTMGVENWPFLDAGNFLQFGIDVRVSRRDGTDLGLESATEASINQQQVQFNLGDGLMIGVPKTAVLDGAQRDIEAVLDVGANRQSIDWTFPSFQTSLFYDPVVGAEEASSPSIEPSFQPSSFPSEAPSSEPSSKPSSQILPADSPSSKPTSSILPTLPPTMDQWSGSLSAEDGYIVGSTLVEFVGRPGQLRFCKLDDGSTSCNGRFVQLKMDHLREIDSTGGVIKNKVSAFASQDFTWSQPEEIDIVTNDTAFVRGTRVSFSAQLRVGNNSPNGPKANFTMETVTYNTNGTAQNGISTIVVPGGALKFTIEVTGWPFLNTNNTLQFGVDIRVNHRNGTNLELKAHNWTGSNQGGNAKFNLGDGLVMDIPTSAVLDGEQKDIEASLNLDAGRQSLEWTFPSFQSSLYYDPVIGASKETPPKQTPPRSAGEGKVGRIALLHVAAAISTFVFF